jgi:hypothetical protein
MDGKGSWVVSMAIHGMLLLGATVMAIDYIVFVRGEGEGSDFDCRLNHPTLKLDRIERPSDHFIARKPSEEESDLTEVLASTGPSEIDHGGWFDCDCGCGGAASTLVAWPRDLVGYFDRKFSMSTSRKGAPRLKTHSRRCASRDTGIETDCNCGLVPRGTERSGGLSRLRNCAQPEPISLPMAATHLNHSLWNDGFCV